MAPGISPSVFLRRAISRALDVRIERRQEGGGDRRASSRFDSIFGEGTVGIFGTAAWRFGSSLLGSYVTSPFADGISVNRRDAEISRHIGLQCNESPY
jgi:hypothetical protein